MDLDQEVVNEELSLCLSFVLVRPKGILFALLYWISALGRLRAGWLNGGRGAARAEDAQGTPHQSHISPSLLVCADNFVSVFFWLVLNASIRLGVRFFLRSNTGKDEP